MEYAVIFLTESLDAVSSLSLQIFHHARLFHYRPKRQIDERSALLLVKSGISKQNKMQRPHTKMHN